MPQLSVIIPALDEAAAIQRAVESAFRSGASEVIVVDGGSGDATREIATAAGAVVLSSQRGRAFQMNRGAQNTHGDVLLFLHADSWLAPECGSQIAECLSSPSRIGGAFRHRFDHPASIYRIVEWADGWRVRLFRMAYGDQGIFVRRALFEQLGGFPEVPLLEDVLFMQRLRRRGSIALLPGPLHTSARRFQRRGVARQLLTNQFVLWAHTCGVSTERLARFLSG